MSCYNDRVVKLTLWF